MFSAIVHEMVRDIVDEEVTDTLSPAEKREPSTVKSSE